MKSKGDPILDLQALCQEKPHTEAELEAAYKALGWGPPFGVAVHMASGTYIVKGEDGLYRPRAGNTREIIEKTLRGA
jgi:hypothetical protein